MRGTVFYKMTGSGNDFIMLDGRHCGPADWPRQRIVEVCDRRLGVGADGLVFLAPEGQGRVRMIFYNCDGSRAAMCGNAALCSTRLSVYLELAPASGMELVSDAGTFRTRCRGDDSEAQLNLPAFEPPSELSWVERRPGEDPIWLGTVGVPHLVVPVSDLDLPDLMARGRELRYHRAAGPDGANVNFVTQLPGASDWAVRTYERGVEGETLACGTGAVAAAVTLAGLGRTDLPARMATRSGRVLEVAACLGRGKVDQVWLTGEGRLVYQGLL